MDKATDKRNDLREMLPDDRADHRPKPRVKKLKLGFFRPVPFFVGFVGGAVLYVLFTRFVVVG